jgi:hypothetical protein
MSLNMSRKSAHSPPAAEPLASARMQTANPFVTES